MRIRYRILNILLLAAVVPAAPLFAQGGVVRGRVTDSTGAAVARASVLIDGSAARASSDDRGDYVLAGVAAGSWTVRVRAIGFQPQSALVTVTAGGTTRQDFRLVATPIGLAAIDVVVGSRARHSAAEELAVPVDVYTAEDIAQQGSTETSQILQALSPSVNFPRQSVTDATDVVRPFTMRGLSPDHTLVLVNGWRRHQTAVVNTFAYGTGAGSSGVDMNTLPASAIERLEVLRDGASAQYGSDAIAGVVNVVLRERPFTPFLNATVSRYVVDDYADDGTAANINAGVSFGLGRGSLALFAEVLDRRSTNRAWADPFDDSGNGLTDSVSADGKVIVKRNNVPQPNHHWGDGEEEDILTMANFRMPLNSAGTSELYAFGGLSMREGTGQGYRRYETSARNWPQVYSLGFLPQFSPEATDYSATGGYRALAGAWSLDLGGSFGRNAFTYNLENTLNTSLGPCLVTACAPGDDGIFGNLDDPGIPNQTSFFAGRLTREEIAAGLTAGRYVRLGLRAPVHVAIGAMVRRERYVIEAGETASWIDGGHLAQDSSDAAGGSQVFPGFAPSDATDQNRTNVGVFVDLETDLSPGFLVNLAGRFENYSDFGSNLNGKLAMRFRPSPRLALRTAFSTGFRAPGLGQSHFSKVVTNVIAGTPVEIGVYPVGHPAAVALGAVPLREETSYNLSGGFAWSPTSAFTLTADYYEIIINDRILLGATFDDAATLTILAANGFTGIGGVQYFTNGLNTSTQGVDLTAELRARAGPGSLVLTGALNYTKNTIDDVDPLPAPLQAAASTEPGIIDSVTYIGITEERPDVRGTIQAVYSVGRLRLLGRGSYFGTFSSAQPGFCDLCRERYGAKALFDLEVGYRLSRLDVTVGVRNLLDTYPDQPSSTVDVGGGTPARDFNNNFGTFPWAAASPFGYNGRQAYLRLGVPLGR